MHNRFVKNEKQVVFVSKDADGLTLRPRLVIETSTVGSTSVSGSGDSISLIAAAMAVGAGGGTDGFIFYRRWNQQRSTLQLSSRSEEASTLEHCPKCGKEISKDFKICPFCEYDPRHLKCDSCGRDISKDYKVCPYCGTKINR